MTAYDLHADRQTLRSETAWDRDSRQSCDGNKIAGLHPVDVGLHLHSIDRSWIRLRNVEWWNLRRRQHEEGVLLEEDAHAVIDGSVLRLGAANVQSAQL